MARALAEFAALFLVVRSVLEAPCIGIELNVQRDFHHLRLEASIKFGAISENDTMGK